MYSQLIAFSMIVIFCRYLIDWMMNQFLFFVLFWLLSVGWGVGGIEAEAVMMDQPVSHSPILSFSHFLNLSLFFTI
jgi:hypothetical protein